MKKIIRQILSVNWPLSIFLCFYYLPLRKAVKIPILVGYNVRIRSLGERGSLTIPSRFASLCFALKGGPFALGNKSFWYLGKNTSFVIKGTARFSKGTNLKLFDNAELIIADKFSANANLIISCASHIEFGEDNLLGWNITIMDNDGGHQLLKDGIVANTPKPIVFGDHVWMAAECSVLKGSKISNGSVIGYKSNVCGLICETENAVIVGNPAKIKNDSIRWEH